jgi:nitrite reductase/ring-hydroxylating ferredoxin subunit
MSETCHRICPLKELAVNSIHKFDVDGHPVAIYHIDGVVYATDDTCTHGMSSLSKGELDGDVVECSLHFGAFHVPTGKAVGLPCSIALKTYRTEVREDVVHVYREAK